MKDLILKHDADHAGGGKEIVYSSDGMDVPPLSFPVKTEFNPDDEIDTSELMAPEAAFQIFANKLFIANPYSNNNSQNRTAVKGDTDSATILNESPLARMSRLKRELELLENDCSTKNDFGLFQDQFIQMKNQLNILLSSQQQKQMGLSSSIDASVTAIVSGTSSTVDPSAIVPATTSTTPFLLEERLNRLENVLLGGGGGSSSSGDNSGGSLAARIQSLEAVLHKLDEKKLDVLQKRSKVIRQDLEAAAKARNKLSTMTNSNDPDDSKIITSLYDGLQSLHGMADHLPILSSRLQALAHLHADSATRMQRFQIVEQLSNDLSKQIQSIEMSLSSLDQSMKENATIMQENIKALEERLNAL